LPNASNDKGRSGAGILAPVPAGPTSPPALAGRWRRLSINLGLSAGSLLVCGLALEVAARHQAAARVSGADAAREQVAQRHPVLGWEKPPGTDVWLRRAEYEVHFQVNAHGLRGPDRPYSAPPGLQRILLLGDSFAEGYTVPEEATVRARLEALLNGARPRYEVLNGGTHGYSTDQEYLFYQSEGVRYGARWVVLLFYYNDLFGNTTDEGGKPYFTLDGDRLVRHAPPISPTPERAATRSPYRPMRLTPWHGSMALRLLSDRTARANPQLHEALARLGLAEPLTRVAPPELWPFGPDHREPVTDMWQRTRALLAALAGETRAAGARLLVVYVPARFEVHDRTWALTRERWALGDGWRRERVRDELTEACRGLGLTLLDLWPALREASGAGEPLYLRQDAHWTAAGNAVAAREIATHIQ
jgi:hypothetical protein